MQTEVRLEFLPDIEEATSTEMPIMQLLSINGDHNTEQVYVVDPYRPRECYQQTPVSDHFKVLSIQDPF